MVAAAVWSGPPGTSVTGDCMAACAPDLAPLRAAEHLEVLALHTTQVDDLSPLSGLPALVELELSHNPRLRSRLRIC